MQLCLGCASCHAATRRRRQQPAIHRQAEARGRNPTGLPSLSTPLPLLQCLLSSVWLQQHGPAHPCCPGRRCCSCTAAPPHVAAPLQLRPLQCCSRRCRSPALQPAGLSVYPCIASSGGWLWSHLQVNGQRLARSSAGWWDWNPGAHVLLHRDGMPAHSLRCRVACTRQLAGRHFDAACNATLALQAHCPSRWYARSPFM